MQAADDPVAPHWVGLDRDQDLIAVLARDGVEGLGVGGRQGVVVALAVGAKRIVRQQADDRRQIGGAGRPDLHGLRAPGPRGVRRAQ